MFSKQVGTHEKTNAHNSQASVNDYDESLCEVILLYCIREYLIILFVKPKWAVNSKIHTAIRFFELRNDCGADAAGTDCTCDLGSQLFHAQEVTDLNFAVSTKNSWNRGGSRSFSLIFRERAVDL